MKKVILSGMRPTGRLHLGHWVGTLANWAKLQEEFACFYMVADYHALMSEYKDPRKLRVWGLDNLADWLAWGIDPEKSVIFLQSDVPQHLELFMILSCLTPLGLLYRCPTFKEQLQQLKDKDVNTYAFLGYPALQAADILLYRASAVPVGEDQLPHLEFTRELARKLNAVALKEILPEPQAMLTDFPRLAGLDGRKMSKSYDNAIYLSDDDDTIKKKVMTMFTDQARLRKTDPGNADVCNLFTNYSGFLDISQAEKDKIKEQCSSASRGCTDCKKLLIDGLCALIGPRRSVRDEMLKDQGRLQKILEAGSQKAREAAAQTMAEIKAALKL